MSILSQKVRDELVEDAIKYAETLNLPKIEQRRKRMQLKLEKLRQDAELKKAKTQIQNWVDLNENFINDEIIKNFWKKTTAKSARDFILKVVRSFAVNDAINKSQDVFRFSLGMKNIEIDMDMVQRLSEKVFSIGALQTITSFSGLDKKYIEDIMFRYISSQFPYKDKTEQPKQEPKLSQLVGEQFEHLMQQAAKDNNNVKNRRMENN